MRYQGWNIIQHKVLLFRFEFNREERLPNVVLLRHLQLSALNEWLKCIFNNVPDDLSLFAIGTDCLSQFNAVFREKRVMKGWAVSILLDSRYYGVFRLHRALNGWVGTWWGKTIPVFGPRINFSSQKPYFMCGIVIVIFYQTQTSTAILLSNSLLAFNGCKIVEGAHDICSSCLTVEWLHTKATLMSISNCDDSSNHYWRSDLQPSARSADVH